MIRGLSCYSFVPAEVKVSAPSSLSACRCLIPGFRESQIGPDPDKPIFRRQTFIKSSENLFIRADDFVDETPQLLRQVHLDIYVSVYGERNCDNYVICIYNVIVEKGQLKATHPVTESSLDACGLESDQAALRQDRRSCHYHLLQRRSHHCHPIFYFVPIYRRKVK